MDMMTKPVVIAQFQKIHPQMYRALVDFEVIQQCEDTTQTLTTEWSEKYKSWADKLLQDNQQLAADKVDAISSLLSKPEITETPDHTKNTWGKAVDNLAVTYASSAIARGNLQFQRDSLLSLPPKHTLGIQRRDFDACDTGSITPSATSTPPPPPPAPPTPTPTICPPPDRVVNLAANPCDQKCMGAGWGNCDKDEKDVITKYSCYCNDGPCGGRQCGDPVKIAALTKKRACPYHVPNIWFPDDYACDVACPNGNYGAGDSCFFPGVDKNGNKVHWESGGISMCKCDDDPCKGLACVDRIHDT